MSENVKKIGFGYIDDTSDDLKSKQGGKFGLNQGAFLTRFELNPNAGKDGTPGEAIDYTVQVADREYMGRIYPTTKVYDNKGNEITDVNSAEYVRGYNEDWKQKNAVIVHILKSFRTEDEIKTALSANIASFGDFVNIVVGLLPADYKSRPLDLFLEYQWNIADGQDRTFLQVPRNMKGGYFVIPMQTANGEWKEVRDDKGLRYVDNQGTVHPFTRDKNYMEGNKANQQIEGEEMANEQIEGEEMANEQLSEAAGGAKKSTW